MSRAGKFGELKESVLLALDVLRRNPMRSLLTVLGIMIGVTTIIVIGAVINGLNANVLNNISQLGSSTIICYRFSWATLGRASSAPVRVEWSCIRCERLSLLIHSDSKLDIESEDMG